MHFTTNEPKVTQSKGIPAGRDGVYAMPVVPHFAYTHQWLREIRHDKSLLTKRGKNVYAVYFRIPDHEQVQAGHFYRRGQPNTYMELTASESAGLFLGLIARHEHQQDSFPAAAHTLSETQHALLSQGIWQDPALATPDGFEVIIPRSISRREIVRVKLLPQIIGWRYAPHQNGKPFCACPACLTPGSYRSRQKALRHAEHSLEVSQSSLHFGLIDTQSILWANNGQIPFGKPFQSFDAIREQWEVGTGTHADWLQEVYSVPSKGQAAFFDGLEQMADLLPVFAQDTLLQSSRSYAPPGSPWSACLPNSLSHQACFYPLDEMRLLIQAIHDFRKQHAKQYARLSYRNMFDWLLTVERKQAGQFDTLAILVNF